MEIDIFEDNKWYEGTVTSWDESAKVWYVAYNKKVTYIARGNTSIVAKRGTHTTATAPSGHKCGDKMSVCIKCISKQTTTKVGSNPSAFKRNIPNDVVDVDARKSKNTSTIRSIGSWWVDEDGNRVNNPNNSN